MADIAARDEWVDDDGDVCRVCRTEAEEGKPLMHPCKCSGSVRYVHGDCLQEWLTHNGKRYCEICGHHYTFSKVYPIPPPPRIPVGVYARQSIVIAARLAWGVARICIAICSWLVVLPILTMAFLRVVLHFAQSMSYASIVYGIRHVIIDSHADLNETLSLRNSSIIGASTNKSMLSGRERVLRMIAQNSTADVLPPLTERMAYDVENVIAFVFRGQIVAISVATCLIGLVLLREWISQLEWNARPPMEDAGDIDLSEWAFRNGQAIRLDHNAALTDADSNQADAGYDTAEVGDVIVEGIEGEEGEGTAVDDWEDDDQVSECDDMERLVRPTPADNVARAFIAPELLAEEQIDSNVGPLAEAGPSSRPMADVREDVQALAPLFSTPAWDPGASNARLADSSSSSSGLPSANGNEPDGRRSTKRAAAVDSPEKHADEEDKVPSNAGSGGYDERLYNVQPPPPDYYGVELASKFAHPLYANLYIMPDGTEVTETGHIHHAGFGKEILHDKPPSATSPEEQEARDRWSEIRRGSRRQEGQDRAAESSPEQQRYVENYESGQTERDEEEQQQYNGAEKEESRTSDDELRTEHDLHPPPNGRLVSVSSSADQADEVLRQPIGSGGSALDPISSQKAAASPSDDGPVSPALVEGTPQANSPATDSPETPGSPGSGAFSDAEDEEENVRRVVAAVVEQYRDRTERQPLDRHDFERRLADLNDGRHRREDGAPELLDNLAAPFEALGREVPNAGWDFADNNNGLVVDADVVERVMAVNNMDAAGMDILPEDDDDRPLDADDWDGILGVIGFIGPLTDLLHNHIFVMFAMALTLSVLVGIPVFMGKTLLAIDIIRASRDLYFINLRAVALLSKLIVAVAGWFLREVLMFPRMVIKTLTKYVFETAGVDTIGDVNFFDTALNFSASYLSRDYSTNVVQNLQYMTEAPIVGPAMNKLLDGMEVLGGAAHRLYTVYRLKAIAVAASSDSSDQLLCMVVGYTTLSTLLICVAIADAAAFPSLDPIWEKSRSIRRFLKVVFFMSLEIVCFPIFVGFAMDVSTLTLFGSTLADRLARLSHRPFGTIFVLWASGTIFMISFATFLTHMKKKGCRPGAVYFIRDPSDPSHSPVKEIMDRPALAQLPRLAVSASMYLLVVFSVCGAVPCGLWALGKSTAALRGFLPLRLEQRPLSSVPFDLLFLHLVLPPSWEGLDMYRRFKKLFLHWWTFVVSTLDLSSLIFGIQARPRPQSRFAQLAWIVADAACQFVFGHYDNRATRARVPNNDRVELVSHGDRRRESVFIPLDHKGSPKTEEDKLRLLRQDRLAHHAGRNPRTDYTTITLPEHWRTRVYALLGVILFSAATLVAVVFFVPLAVGRQAAGYLFDGPIYDGYSWLSGVYLCLGSFAVGQSVRRHIVELHRAERLRRSSKSARFKRSVFGILRGAYAVTLLYLVLPLLVGINFELFVSIPLRYGSTTNLTPVLHLWDAWATGAALLSLYVGAVGMALEEQVRVPRGNRLREAFKKPLRQRFSTLTSTVMPPMAWFLMIIILPWLLCSGTWKAWQMIGVPLPHLDMLFRMVYPMSWLAILVLLSWRAIKGGLTRVRQWMIDAEYVVAEQVENYESDGPIELVPGTTYQVIDGETEAIIEASDEGEGEGEWEDVVVE